MHNVKIYFLLTCDTETKMV